MKQVMFAAFALMCVAIAVAVVNDYAQADAMEAQEVRSGPRGPKCSWDQLRWLGRNRVRVFGYPKGCYD